MDSPPLFCNVAALVVLVLAQHKNLAEDMHTRMDTIAVVVSTMVDLVVGCGADSRSSGYWRIKVSDLG